MMAHTSPEFSSAHNFSARPWCLRLAKAPRLLTNCRTAPGSVARPLAPGVRGCALSKYLFARGRGRLINFLYSRNSALRCATVALFSGTCIATLGAGTRFGVVSPPAPVEAPSGGTAPRHVTVRRVLCANAPRELPASPPPSRQRQCNPDRATGAENPSPDPATVQYLFALFSAIVINWRYRRHDDTVCHHSEARTELSPLGSFRLLLLSSSGYTSSPSVPGYG